MNTNVLKPLLAVIIIVLAIIGNVAVAATADSSKIRRVEIVLNFTNALTRFAGQGARNLSEDPYLLAIKLRNKRNTRAWRLGINQSYVSTSTDLFPGSRESKDFYVSPLFGHEWRMQLDKNFMFYTGLDVRYSSRQIEVVTFSPAGFSTSIKDNINGYGAGPFAGFVWMVNKRVSIYTEANIYVTNVNTERKLIDQGTVYKLESSNKFIITPSLPTSLFISLLF